MSHRRKELRKQVRAKEGPSAPRGECTPQETAEGGEVCAPEEGRPGETRQWGKVRACSVERTACLTSGEARKERENPRPKAGAGVTAGEKAGTGRDTDPFP